MTRETNSASTNALRNSAQTDAEVVLRHARALQTLRAFAQPNTVLFDLDGTLIDSVEDIHVAVNALLAELGFATRTRDEVAMWE